MMLITVTGRKSGRRITLPVSYYPEKEILWVFSNRDRTWWRNLKGGAEIGIRLRGRELSAHGEAILDEKLVADQLAHYLRNVPALGRFIGVNIVNGKPDDNDIKRVARERLFVKIQPSEIENFTLND